jgi:two-component system NtrC family sensor kinase
MYTFPNWKILLIDDEEDILDVMTISLEDSGCQVETAADGEAGLRLCEEILPQIVITDILMPKMDGIQVLKIIKERFPDTEVIVVTAFGDMKLAIQALQFDASDVIVKPIDDQALYSALKRAKNRYAYRKQLRDYTDFLKKETAYTAQELIKTYSFQKTLTECSMDGILVCDDKDNVVIFNKSLQQILGYSKENILQKMTFDQFFSPGEAIRLKQKMESEQHGEKNRPFLQRTNLIERDGDKIPVQVSAAALFDNDRKEGMVYFFRDLREIHKLEKEIKDQARLLHREKMMSLGRLAASVANEINNPLSGILNYSRLMIYMLERGPIEKKRREKFKQYLELIENETGRCGQIVSNLLAFSGRSPPAFEQIMIDDLLRRCIELSQHKLQNIRLESSIELDIPPIEGDFKLLQQCVINLIYNAVDSMPGGGTLTLKGNYDPEKAAVKILVKDTGEGISEKDLPYIFDPFFTIKEEGYGMGLGLATVFGIMEHHNGTIDVESRPGAGTTFILSFLCKQAPSLLPNSNLWEPLCP